MGFSVYVADIVSYVAQCSEIGCEVEFEIRENRDKAELDAHRHREYHAAAWRRYQDQIDKEYYA